MENEPQHVEFTVDPGVKVHDLDATSEPEIFSKFLTEEHQEKIIRETNQDAYQIMSLVCWFENIHL